MELMTCKNGHRYDPSITPECPECARARREGYSYPGGTVPLDGDKTAPVQFGRGKTVPVNRTPDHWANAADYDSAGRASDSYDETKPVNYGKVGNLGQPVTGWLVCIDGSEKGRDYRLHAEYNYIGRSSHMDVCIAGDPTVSRENHAIIAYDTRERLFFFAPSSGGSIVRHNGKAVLGNVELKTGDRIEIGQGTYLFVPLCGENFQWED